MAPPTCSASIAPPKPPCIRSKPRLPIVHFSLHGLPSPHCPGSKHVRSSLQRHSLVHQSEATSGDIFGAARLSLFFDSSPVCLLVPRWRREAPHYLYNFRLSCRIEPSAYTWILPGHLRTRICGVLYWDLVDRWHFWFVPSTHPSNIRDRELILTNVIISSCHRTFGLFLRRTAHGLDLAHAQTRFPRELHHRDPLSSSSSLKRSTPTSSTSGPLASASLRGTPGSEPPLKSTRKTLGPRRGRRSRLGSWRRSSSARSRPRYLRTFIWALFTGYVHFILLIVFRVTLADEGVSAVLLRM